MTNLSTRSRSWPRRASRCDDARQEPAGARDDALKDRCTALGWGELYETYGQLSALLHGSPGGLIGNQQERREGRVLRFGPSIELLIISTLMVARTLEHLLDHVEAHWPDAADAAGSLRPPVDQVLAGWPDMRKALRKLDQMIWPRFAPSDPGAIVAIYPNGRRKWMIHDPLTDTVVLAEAPTSEDYQYLESLDAHLATIPPGARGSDGRPVVVLVLGLTLTPQPGARPGPARGVMEGLSLDGIRTIQPLERPIVSRL